MELKLYQYPSSNILILWIWLGLLNACYGSEKHFRKTRIIQCR